MMKQSKYISDLSVLLPLSIVFGLLVHNLLMILRYVEYNALWQAYSMGIVFIILMSLYSAVEDAK